MDLINELESLAPDFKSGLSQASSLEELDALAIRFLGRKGRLAGIMKQIPALSQEQRQAVGKKANQVKELCASLLDTRAGEIRHNSEAAFLARFDPGMPGRRIWYGTLHPTTIVIEEICRIFRGMGFSVASGPEVEIDRYNFECLNMPPDHPARDMQDTLYITDSVLMRTHTSPVQVRTMLASRPPLAVIAPGKVYRRDSDITHTPMFHQVEGLLVDYGISMADLRGTLTYFLRSVFGEGISVRFRPSFFPFTEPSAEVDISCCICGGKGHIGNEPCRVCKTSGWVEILGCGMVDPAVFAAVDYPADISGFAFGLGIERIAMLQYGIGDLRMFFENDVRFLQQFGQYV